VEYQWRAVIFILFLWRKFTILLLENKKSLATWLETWKFWEKNSSKMARFGGRKL
jgi:hypothetical protein